MRRRVQLSLGAALLFAVAPSWAAAKPDGGVDPKADAGAPPLAITSTRTAKVTPALLGASAEELELATYLDLLENIDVLENWELLSVMPALEEDE